jgi:hypothetical protein
MNPNVILHIERLILDGLPLKPGEERLVQAAFETELTRLIAAGGLGEGWQSGGAVPWLPTAPVEVGAKPSPAGIGRQAAQSVYGSFNGQGGGRNG